MTIYTNHAKIVCLHCGHMNYTRKDLRGLPHLPAACDKCGKKL